MILVNWISCVQPTENEQVHVQHTATLFPRSENVVIVHCPKSKPLLTVDFEPAPINDISSVYGTNCRIIRDLNGHFQPSLQNFTKQPVSLYSRTHVGTLTSPTETFHHVSSINENIPEFSAPDVNIGTNQSEVKRAQLSAEFANTSIFFAFNPRKPMTVTTMEHYIITGDSQPIRRKPY